MLIGDGSSQSPKLHGHRLISQKNEKLQSAMEYLMTYGWAILVIAVVLGVLYSLGIFNPSNFAPKAQPGSCQVFRPNGPGTGYDVNLEGTCNNELPQYVGQFNGASSYVSIGPSQGLISGNVMTYVIWADQLGTGSSGLQSIILSQDLTYFAIGISSCYVNFAINNGGYAKSSSCIADGRWVQYVATYNGVTITLYLNGVAVGSGSYTAVLQSQQTKIGMLSRGDSPPDYNFNGLISDVQIYNTSLSANEVAALYDEGIGGVPLNLNNLVGWWPLNGNADDYSGNNNNGASTAVSYTGSWQPGYTAP